MSLAPTLDWLLVGTGDFNGDGRHDMLWHNENDGRVVVWLMDQSGLNLQGGGLLPFAPTLDWSVAGTGDFNGDGRDDIVWRNNNDGRVVPWLMDETGMNLSGGGTTPVAHPGLDYRLRRCGRVIGAPSDALPRTR